MGRYYSGDIDGKLWVGIQSSSAADRFGVIGDTPGYLVYYFERQDLPAVIEELDSIRKTLGKHFDVIDKFFQANLSYDDKTFIKETGIEEARYRFFISEYADYYLGLKIKESIEKNGECKFEVEQ
jgi:hypothetical protein